MLEGRDMVTRQDNETLERKDDLDIDFGLNSKKPMMSKKNNLNEDSDWDLDNY